jgi:DNA-binding winged helix-turn-helix (wHTH) protein
MDEVRAWRDDQHGDEVRVWIDDAGLLHRGSAWVALSDLEWRVLGLLVARLGELVGREELMRAGWPTQAGATRLLNRCITRARRRLAPLGLHIRGVRGKGYVLGLVA